MPPAGPCFDSTYVVPHDEGVVHDYVHEGSMGCVRNQDELPETAAEVYGSVRAQLEARGAMIDNNDLWIAAHALSSNLTLVTNNEREFQRIHGLKLQNWAV